MTNSQDTNNINHTDVLTLEMEAREARAEAITQMLSSVAGVFSKAFKWISERNELIRQRNELYALDDRILEDIGISRDQIDGPIVGTLRSPISGLISGFSSFIGYMFAGLTSWFSTLTKAQSLREELNSFTNSELSDIGISRSDIEDIVAGTYVSRRRGLDTTNVKVLKQPKVSDDQKLHDDPSIAA